MKRVILLLAGVFVLLIGLTPTVSATQPAGPVTIEVVNDFSSFPFQGVFQVSAGADSLGCDSGTTELEFRGRLQSATVVRAHFDCGGDGTEDFVLQFNPGQRTAPPLSGSWQAWRGYGEFAGLRGQGVWHFDGLTETFSGDIHFHP